MSRSRTLRVLPLGLMAVTVFVTYVAIAWTLRRGFDWTDEAFVYTMIASNRIAVGEPWGFQHLLHPLYVVTGQSVLAFRVIRLVGYALLSVGLVWCARTVVRRLGITIPRSGWAFILLLAQVGTFLAWGYPPRYLGYNELASWLAQLGVALILVSLSWGVSSPRNGVSSPRNREGSRVLWPIWAGLGAVTMLLVFARVTSGLAFGAFLALVIVVPNLNLRLWKRVVAAGGGAAAVLLVLWVVRCPIGPYFKNAFALLFDKSARKAFGHPISGMISTYAHSLLSTGRALLPVLLIFSLAMATFHRRARAIGDGGRGRALDWMTWILGVLLVVALVALPRPDVWSYLGVLIVFIGAAGIIGLAILGADHAVLHGSALSRSFSVAVGVSAVVAAPFISSLGTSNGLTGQFVFAATLWAVVLGIALVRLTQRGALLKSSARSMPALIGCVVLLITAFAVKADIAKPYRTAPLLSQETSTSVPELRGLLLTAPDAAWIDWVSAAGDSERADHVPATAIASSGALYAFNQSGYANPWVGMNWPIAFTSLSLACAKRPSDLFVLQPGTATKDAPSTTGVTKSLAACGISFPGDFRVVDQRASADPERAMTIWRLK